MRLNEGQQSFLQEMMSGALTERQATELYNARVNNGDVDPVRVEDLGDALEEVNTAIRRYGMQLNAASHRGEVWWGLVNTQRDEAVKNSSSFTDAEQKMFSTIASAIKTSPSGEVLLDAARNLDFGKNVSVSDCDRLLGRLKDRQWLSLESSSYSQYSQDIAVSFGPRAVLELPDVRRWLRDRPNHQMANGGGMDDDDPSTPRKSKKRSSRRGDSSKQRRRSSRRDVDSDEEMVDKEDDDAAMGDSDDDDEPTKRRRSSGNSPTPRRSSGSQGSQALGRRRGRGRKAKDEDYGSARRSSR